MGPVSRARLELVRLSALAPLAGGLGRGKNSAALMRQGRRKDAFLFALRPKRSD